MPLSTIFQVISWQSALLVSSIRNKHLHDDRFSIV